MGMSARAARAAGQTIYSVCRASIGDRRIAFIAGYSPKRIPIKDENRTEASNQCAQ